MIFFMTTASQNEVHSRKNETINVPMNIRASNSKKNAEHLLQYSKIKLNSLIVFIFTSLANTEAK